MESIVYLRMHKRVQAKFGQQLIVEDVCQCLAPANYQWLKKIPLKELTIESGNFHVIDLFEVCRIIQEQAPEIEIKHMGPVQTLIEVPLKTRIPKGILVVFVWLILFIGSGLAIMNFHTDVSMKQVHQRIYFLLTGQHVEYPLLLQVSYSLGIGLGMILFFNHVFRRRLNEEPSPMELEMFLYQETIDQYVIEKEKQKQREIQHEPDS